MEEETKTISQLLKEYTAENRVKICILTPCYGGMCHINYTVSLMATLDAMREYGIRCKVEFCKNDSLVSRARNNLIARAMGDTEVTHFLFIDSDITWTPIEIFKLLLSGKDLCGGLYPIKHYQWEKITKNPDENITKKWLEKKQKFDILNNTKDEDIIKHHLLRYNMNHYGVS